MPFRKSPANDIGVFAKKRLREERYEPRVSIIIVLTLSAFLFGAMVLASNTIVPELARADGEIVPSGRAHQIESLSGGIVGAVFVVEGQRVEKNEVIATLTLPNLQRDEDDARQQLNSTEAKIAALVSILEFLDAGDNHNPVVTKTGQNKDFSATRLALHIARQEIALQQVHHLQTMMQTLQNARTLMQERVALKVIAIDRISGLLKTGNITRIRLEAEQDALDDLRGRLIDADIQLATTQTQIAQAQSVVHENDLTLREQTLSEMFELEREREALQVRLASLARQRDDLVIRAPEAGFIQSVSFPRLGEVIEPGAAMFELINTTDRLVAEIKIDTRDIGHVEVGDAVALKMATYDARRYGQVRGAIESLSPTFVEDPQDGRTYFRGVVGLDQTTIGQGAWQRRLKVGMVANAEIVTDERSMLAYLLKPIQRSLERAFGER